MSKIESLIKKHSSVRRYKEVDISEKEVMEMIQVAQHASSSHFVQAYSIILVSNPELKVNLSKLSGNKHIATCSTFLLFCADLERLNIACNMYGREIESQSAENLLVATIDTALIAQNFSLVAESRGYGICFIGGVRNEPLLVSSLLQLPKRVFPMFGMTVGVPDESNEVKPRLPVEAIVHKNVYDNKKYEDLLKSYDEVIRGYYQARLNNKKESGWSEPMSDYMSTKNRENIRLQLAERGLNID